MDILCLAFVDSVEKQNLKKLWTYIKGYLVIHLQKVLVEFPFHLDSAMKYGKEEYIFDNCAFSDL